MTRPRNPFTRLGDHVDMKRNRGLADREVEALLRAGATGGDELTAALALLRREGTGPAPAPSTALAAQLSEGFVPPTAVAVALKPARRRLQISLVVAGATSGLLLAATGANALPAPGQRAVAGILNIITPFHFPTPATDQPASPKPAPEVDPVEQPSEAPTDEPSETPSRDAPSRNETDGTAGTDGTDGTTDSRDEPSGSAPDGRPDSQPDSEPTAGSGDSAPSGDHSSDPSPSPVDAPDAPSGSSPDGNDASSESP